MIKLKNILTEAYAWERQDGKPLPTLKDVQEAYDAKGIDEAADEAADGAKPDYIDLDGDGNEEESMKKAAADKKSEKETNEGENGPAYKGPIGYDDSTDSYQNEGDDENHGIHATMPKHDDSEETDLGVLNMGSLEESKFWGRVTGNLKGHEYILREAFRK
jgi:hypothetical protein